MIVDTEQLLKQSEIMEMKGMSSLSHLAYYLAKPDAPKPVAGMRPPTYLRKDVLAWNPKRDARGKKRNGQKTTYRRKHEVRDSQD